MGFIAHLSHPSFVYRRVHILRKCNSCSNCKCHVYGKNIYFKTWNNFGTWHIDSSSKYMYLLAKIKLWHEHDKVQNKCDTRKGGFKSQLCNKVHYRWTMNVISFKVLLKTWVKWCICTIYTRYVPFCFPCQDSMTIDRARELCQLFGLICQDRK
jgi:hypothetical protein